MRVVDLTFVAGVLLLVSGCGSDATEPAPVDRAAPQVSITSPAAGAVTGVVTITADATDDVGVTVVQWEVNGAPLADRDSTAPFQHEWDTTLSAVGIYEWVAIARDKSGKSTESAPVTYTVGP